MVSRPNMATDMAKGSADVARPGKARRDYADGSIYQRTSDWRWMGSVDNGWNENGTRRRRTVSTKGCDGGCKPRCPHVVEIERKVRDLKLSVKAGEGAELAVRSNTTIKGWADEWLPIKQTKLAPKGYNALASPVRKWIVPTIGHKRLNSVSPGDVRAVQNKVKAATSLGNAAAVHRALMNLLNSAVKEGHNVPRPTLLVEAPEAGESDRTALTLEETIRCLEVASYLPHGVRWALALLHGPRQNEVLGLTDDCLDFERRTIELRYQLQSLPYIDRKNKALGFRIPDRYDENTITHLVDAWHLVPVKSKKGIRVLPMPDAIADALRDWMAIRPANPWGLLFPTASGRPAGDKHDREEFWAIQYTASVGAVEPGEYAAPLDLPPVFHPKGKRFYHVHECRNVAATQLDETGASDNVITSMLGHASITTSRRYQTAHLDAKRVAADAVAARILPNRPAEE